MHIARVTRFFFFLKLGITAYGAPASSSSSVAVSTASSSVHTASISVPSSGTFSAPGTVSASISSGAAPAPSSVTGSQSNSIPAPSTTDASIPVTTAGFAPLTPNGPVAPILSDPEDMVKSPQGVPAPIRDTLGAEILGPQNVALQFESPDFLAPPTTDSGSVANAKWPFALSHNRIQTGGWARQQNTDVMPIATAMAGVNMRLKPGAVRELHWHSTAEWAYVIKGSVRVSVVTPDSQNYLADVHAGDIWYFPPGLPHSLQALNDTGVDGSEFLLVFDSGDFSEDNTFLLTDWLAHIPKEVLAKNFNADISVFDHIPEEELYIFPTNLPGALADVKKEIQAPNGQPTNGFSFPFSQMKATQLQGGTVKITDSTIFNVSKTIAAAEVTVEPGAMRELHWHPTEPEWSYFLSGNARVTIFAASGNSRTFDYSAGDVGYVPPSFGHYVENVGNETVRYLEIFKSDRYQDISLQQWLALTPPELVRAHLNLDSGVIGQFKKTKGVVVG